MGRAHAVGLWLCVLGGMAACPDVHRPGGKLDRAARKDTLERIHETGCDSDEYEELCPAGTEPTEECIAQCGGR
ncbi:hypothetical protein [Corallococcus sp. 4LFB]|uniref:hypothetical protein n=1 Tax=Corallococcus sp. 4LFB TaxID=3383249 RepID=UPI003974D0DA